VLPRYKCKNINKVHEVCMESVFDTKCLQSSTSKTRMLNNITNILKSKGPIADRSLWKKKKINDDDENNNNNNKNSL
jgi:hypothetical protein